MTYSITIYDTSDNVIGELPTASPTDVLKFLNKGFKVVDKVTHTELTESDINNVIGVSDGAIIC